MDKKSFLLLLLALGMLTNVYSQSIISTTEPDMINFETMLGGTSDLPNYSIVSRVHPYTGDMINTTEFVNSLENSGRVQGGTVKVRPPRVEDKSQLGYVVALLATRHMGTYYHALTIVFIDGLYRDDFTYYFDHGLTNIFDGEPMHYTNALKGEVVKLQQKDSPVEFRIILDDFRRSNYGRNQVSLDPILINRSRLSDDTQLNYKKFMNTVVNPSGLSFYFSLGTGGGGKHEYSIVQADNPEFSITHMHEFRSQSLTLGLTYNLSNLYLSAYSSFENIQPQNGRRITQVNDQAPRIDHGLTNFFPKRRYYFGTELGYDIRISHTMIVSPHAGASTFSYLGNRSELNKTHLNRGALYMGLKLAFPVYTGRTTAFITSNYSRHFFTHADIMQSNPGVAGEIQMQHDNVFHHQLNIAVGIQHKITRTYR